MNEQECKKIAAKTGTSVDCVKATAEMLKARGVEPTPQVVARRIQREKDGHP
jgi:hypothetical protein